MKLHGQRVYLNMPQLQESKISIAPELKEELKREMSKKFNKLTVFAVSDAVTNVKVGDSVLVDPQALSRGTIIEIAGEEKICISGFDIMHTWDD